MCCGRHLVTDENPSLVDANVFPCVPEAEYRRALDVRGVTLSPGAFMFTIGAGWMPHVLAALDDLILVGWDKNLTQVKEKWGGLRIYLENWRPQFQPILDLAYDRCAKDCELCGRPHGRLLPIHICPICKECSEKTGLPYA
jgi:hypothetical protein